MDKFAMNFYYQLLSSKLRKNTPMSTAIKGDFNRYKNILSDIYTETFLREDYNKKTEDGRETHIHFDNRDVFIDVFDEFKLYNQQYNQLLVYITEARNKVEFIASRVPARGEKPYYMEESEYIYEPETDKFYIYYGITSYIENQQSMVTLTYDKEGNEEQRGIHSRNFGTPMVKSKKYSSR